MQFFSMQFDCGKILSSFIYCVFFNLIYIFKKFLWIARLLLLLFFRSKQFYIFWYLFNIFIYIYKMFVIFNSIFYILFHCRHRLTLCCVHRDNFNLTEPAVGVTIQFIWTVYFCWLFGWIRRPVSRPCPTASF